MTDISTALARLRRPRLLIRAARFGLVDYDRDRDLKRLMRTNATPTPARAVSALLEQEHALEETRKDGIAGYSAARHIEILIALIAEARLIPARP